MLDPVATAGLELADVPALRDQVRALIAAKLADVTGSGAGSAEAAATDSS